MSKKSKSNPRMLTHVLQAIADLKDLNGSTARKILDQVQTAISLTKIKPKPRNVVMQVRKALKHAVDAGVLKQRAGKYRLALGMDTDKNYGRKACSKKKKKKKESHAQKKKCKKPDRTRRPTKGIRKKKPCKKYTSLATSSICSEFQDSHSMDTSPADSEMMLRSGRRSSRKTKKGRSGVKKSPRRRRRRSSKRGKRKQRKSRQPAPMPLPSGNKGSEVDDDSNTTASERGGTTRAGNRYQEEYNPEDFPCENYINQHEMDLAPECDNPDCLCNLKQEPYDDNTYDDGAGFNMM